MRRVVSLPRLRFRLRWIGVLVLVAVAVAYLQPIRSYRQTQAEVNERKAEIAELVRANKVLDRRLARTGTDAFIEREARKLGLVRPGERLFIVKGAKQWKQARLP